MYDGGQRMRIALDVDGVLADNHTAWLNRVNADPALAPTKATRFTPDDLTQWEFWKDIGCTKDELFKHWTPDIYHEVKPYDGALTVVATLRALGHTIAFVTSCMTHAEYTEKGRWLKQHGFYRNGDLVVGCGFEGTRYSTKADAGRALMCDWLVDDSVTNCEAWPGYALLLTRPHNRRTTTAVKRLKALTDLPLLLSQHSWDQLHKNDARELQKPAGALPCEPTPQWNDVARGSPLPTDRQVRKDTPVCSGVLDYFTAALAEVARVSKAGNDQHNPGQPLHWARGKSMDHADCVARHLMERGTVDTDGMRHSAKLAWRALALLQQELEDEGAPLSRASKVTGEAA